MILSLPRDWWGYHWSPPHPRSVAELIRAGTLDAELAATLWLLLEARVPVAVVSGPPLAGKSTVLTSLLDFLPAAARVHVLRGRSETFDWLPEAASLGWSWHGRTPAIPGREGRERVVAERGSSFLLAAELSDHLPMYTWGERARVAIRATSIGYGLGTTAHADSLAEFFSQLEGPAVGLTSDELRSLGVVLVLRMFGGDGIQLDPTAGIGDIETAPFAAGVRRRVVAAHYVRPLERDAGGHVQRRPPAVLATWNAAADALDHFEWGIVPELAARVGRTPADFEREQESRTRLLGRLARDGRGFAEVREAVSAYSGTEAVPGVMPGAAGGGVPGPVPGAVPAPLPGSLQLPPNQTNRI